MIDRRSILRAALFVAAAPVIVRVSSLMKVRALPVDDFTADAKIYAVERLGPFYFDPNATWGRHIRAYTIGDIVEFGGNQYVVAGVTPGT